MKNWSWWRARFGETAMALAIVAVVIQLSGEIADRQKELLPASSWLVVNEVYVPDFETGSCPNILYDRAIQENFDAFWIVEVQSTKNDSLWTTELSGSGVKEYDPAEVIPDNTVSWPWFTSTSCDVRPGLYRLKTTYTMTRPGWPQKRIFVLSNEFRVHPPETDFCPACNRALNSK